MFNLNTPVEELYLVGPARAKLLKNLGVKTLKDLLFYFPRAHNDLSIITTIDKLKTGETANIKGKILEVKTFRTKVRHLSITHALIEDETGSVLCVWFNQPYLIKILKSHETFLFSGKVTFEKGKFQLQNPIYEQEKQEQVHTARLVPIYPLTANLTQKILRSIIKTYLDKSQIPEYLPSDIIKKELLLPEDAAVKTFHFPENYPSLYKAKKRLAFDEIFQTQTRVMQYKKDRQTKSAYKIKNFTIINEKIQTIPFTLTNSQNKALNEIIDDFKKEYPANRLLEGDVGSGKTILAALAMWLVAKNDLQSVLLCPTEVLANQHYLSLLSFFKSDNINIALLTSNTSKLNGNPVSKNTILEHIKSGSIKIVMGTHALLEKTVKFEKLALTVIDEQHRFGVEQRSLIKQAYKTHLLTMSATPIPRTLALTLYGDLDISILTELPKGRVPIKTNLVPEDKRNQAYEFIKNEINQGRQAFVICPLIEESDKLGVKYVTAEYKKLQEEVFKDFKVGLLHGRLKPKEKEEVMQKFMNNETQILVATSVIEVGVDVPNATVMVIEGAERFGLAQLHQFRGRVGRSIHKSYCFLFSDNLEAQINPRLQAITESNNGFELAEKDLQIRGGGDLYGTNQSGYGFRVTTLANLDMVEKSRAYAEQLLFDDPKLEKYPLLKQKINNLPLVHLE